jgi:hypothetical protein
VWQHRSVARQWDQGELFRTLRPPDVVEGTSERVRCVTNTAFSSWLRLANAMPLRPIPSIAGGLRKCICERLYPMVLQRDGRKCVKMDLYSFSHGITVVRKLQGWKHRHYKIMSTLDVAWLDFQPWPHTPACRWG